MNIYCIADTDDDTLIFLLKREKNGLSWRWQPGSIKDFPITYRLKRRLEYWTSDKPSNFLESDLDANLFFS